jgi:hypothetical protein
LAVAGQSRDSSLYWRFENGQAGAPVVVVLDESLGVEAQARDGSVSYSDDVFKGTDIDPDNRTLVLPAITTSNHRSVKLDGGFFQIKPFSIPDLSKSFTVELWAKFGNRPSVGEVLLSNGPAARGTWNFLYQADGTVQLAVVGEAIAYLFDGASGGPRPGVWYHLAATFEDCGGDGRKRIMTYVNGNRQGSLAGSFPRSQVRQDRSLHRRFLERAEPLSWAHG